MRLPWQRAEVRAYDYTAQILLQQMNVAAGVEASAATTAAVEACAGLWARGFAVADVSPEPARALLTPDLLADVGRDLALRGGWLAAIDVAKTGEITLTPASWWSVTGPANEDEWVYHAHFSGPSSSRTRDLHSNEVIHVSYARNYGQHDVGQFAEISPLSASRSTARALANLEVALGDELGIHVAQLLVTELNEENEADRAQLASISRLRGKLGFLTGAVSGETGLMAPPTPTRVGHQIPSSTVDIWNAASQAIFNAYGCAGLFVTDTTAAARRDSYRIFAASTLAPLAGKLARAATKALPFGEVTLSFSELKSNDLAARSRSLKALVEAGVPLEQARTMTGFGE